MVEYFNLRGAGVSLNCLKAEGSHSFQPNAWAIIHDLNINLLKLFGGTEGDVWHINIAANPDTWAANLQSLIVLFKQNSVKAYFTEISNEWGQALGNAGMTIDEAKAMIDQLAGNNNLGYNFLTDSVFIGWCVDNEPDITDAATLEWDLALCDYIRSKGAKAWIASPRGTGGWWAGSDFHVTAPILRNHVDFLDRHLYEVDTFANGNFEYQAMYDFYADTLTKHVITGLGAFDKSQALIGEFGIWGGYASDLGYTGVFTDEERAIYYNAVLDAMKAVGLNNVCFHILFPEKNYLGEIEVPQYAVVDFEGNYLAPALVIKKVYSEMAPPPSGCFIATACGTSNAHLSTLRRFRDQCLPLPLVHAYYKASPPLANRIREHENFKRILRKVIEWLVCRLKRNLTF